MKSLVTSLAIVVVLALATVYSRPPETRLAPHAADGVLVSVRPSAVYVERGEAAQHLNFDFILENRTSSKLQLTGIELAVFDRTGTLARRDFVDVYGRPSLELLRAPQLEPGGTVLVFNPLHTFPNGVPLERLRYEFSFTADEGKTHHTASISVNPVLYETKTDLVLPLKGRVLVWDGHDYRSHHRRFDYTHQNFQKVGQRTNFQRYGYDFVLVDEGGVMYRGAPKFRDLWYLGPPDANGDYYSFGAPVYAAGAGRVAAIHDGMPDNRTFDPAELPTRETAYGGNYVVIDHLNGEFSWFGHVKQGSVKVKAGQTVKQGEIIAEVGASGSSLFPHLHYELRNGAGARIVEGLPSYFRRFRRILGSKMVPVDVGLIDTGDIVERVEAR